MYSNADILSMMKNINGDSNSNNEERLRKGMTLIPPPMKYMVNNFLQHTCILICKNTNGNNKIKIKEISKNNILGNIRSYVINPVLLDVDFSTHDNLSLQVYVSQTCKKINTKASKLFGQPIYGDVLILSLDRELTKDDVPRLVNRSHFKW